MPTNNNQQKMPSAAARLSKLPMVHFACSKLSVLYTDTKCSYPKMKSVCEVLESSVTAVVSPVLVQMEPQISVANDVACRSLDWLETAFPVLHTPTEQMHEIQDMVSVAANGTVDCAALTVAWLMNRIQQVDNPADQSLVVMESLSRSTSLVQELQTSWLSLAWNLQGLPHHIQALPQYLQHQLVSMFFFISQMYDLGCPPPQPHPSDQDGSLNDAETPSAHNGVVQARLQAKPTFRARWPTKMPDFDTGCNVK
ncbi:hypothetical protein FQN60_011916 [Etheostoma spectabile]|uniref:Perilipin n=1 Tax=Etheostoma spectabile TaxID=54343 RepID=A0A5J5DN32_9PERO|nr:hypothetical protein FQN60_011916 [Etheostoma spectabile]